MQIQDIEDMVRSVGLAPTKARNLSKMSQVMNLPSFGRFHVLIVLCMLAITILRDDHVPWDLSSAGCVAGATP